MDHAGSLPGDFSIDANGGAVYTIPLAVPPGTAGLAPALAVGYNSGAGNDILGVGWSLRGLSVIGRVPATVATDGFVGAVRFDGQDRFALDGQRLVAVRGTYGAPDAEYRLASDDLRRIVPSGGGFTVWMKDGRRHEYGTTDDSRALAAPSGAVRVWALNRTTDLHGNTLTVRYHTGEDGNLYPERIDYTGHPATGVAPRRAVTFHYADRPDAPTRYVGGCAVTVGRRLAAVTTHVDGALVTSYEFAYAPGVSTGRSLLRSVTRRDAEGRALTPTTFEWQDGNLGVYQASAALESTGRPAGGTLLPMDVDGNGVTDLVYATPSSDGRQQLELTLFLSAPDRGQSWPRFAPPRTLAATGLRFGGLLLAMDVDGDGCMDLVYAVKDGGRLALTVLHAREVDGQWTLIREGEPNTAGPSNLGWGGQLLSGDVDGDGRADLVYVVRDHGHLTIHTLLSNGRAFAESPAGPLRTTLPWASVGQIIPMDWDGDGRADLVYACQGSRGRLALARLASRGRDGFAQLDAAPVERECGFGGTLMPLDLNDDGKVDLVYARVTGGELEIRPLVCDGVDFHLGSSHLTGIHASASNPPTILPAEVNGDGMTDLVVASRDRGRITLQVLLSTGHGFAAAPELRQAFADTSTGGTMLPLDLDGDGRTDLLYAASDGDALTLSRAIAAGQPPDRLIAVTNGLGGRIEVDYQSMTDPAIYRKEPVGTAAHVDGQALVANTVSGAAFHGVPTSALGHGTAGAVYATRSVDFPKRLVAAHRVHDGRGRVDAYTHAYAGAKFDLSGRGWLGFASVSSCDVSSGTTSISEYHQESTEVPAALNLIPRAVTTVRPSDGAWLNRIVYTYEARAGAPGVFQILPTSVETRVYSAAPPGGPPDLIHRKSFEYDGYANPVLTAEVSSDGGAPLYRLETYEPADEARWLIGFKRETKTAADRAGASVLAWERLTYGEPARDLATREIWHDQSQRWLVSTFEHDAYGNETSVTDPAGATSRTVYDAWHTFVAEQHAATASGRPDLVTAYTHDPRFGQVTARSAPYVAGDTPRLVAVTELDGLGRVVEVRAPGPSGALEPVRRHRWVHGDGGPLAQVDTRVSWSEDAPWRWERTHLDGHGRPVRSTALGADGVRTVSRETTFDARGLVVRETLPHYEDEPAALIERAHDEHGRVVRLTEPRADGGSTVTLLSYPDATHVVRTEAAGTADERTTRARLATFHRRSMVVERTDTTGTVTFTFDGLGQPLTATDPGGVTTAATYDTCGRQVSLRIRAGDDVIADEAFRFDDVARTRTEVVSGGATIVTSYDALGRPIARTTPDRTTRFTYDAQGTRGLPVRVETPGGATYEIGHDARGRQSALAVTIDGAVHRLHRTWTPHGAVATQTFPDGSVQVNGYTGAGVMASIDVRDPGGHETRHVTYTAFSADGTPLAATYGNGVHQALTLGPDGQLVRARLAAPGGTPLVDETLHRDAHGLIRTIDDGVHADRSQRFAYDPVGRLVAATGAYPAQAYGYDGAGNLTSRNGTTFHYRGHRLVTGVAGGLTVVAAEYDAAGNMTSISRAGSVRRYAYDGERRLVGCGTTTYGYDHAGRRVSKRTPGGPATSLVTRGYEVTVLPDGRTQRTRSIEGAFGVAAVVTDRDGGPGGAPPDVPAPGTFYVHRNQVDSTTLHTDASGGVAGRLEYLPYGELFRVEGGAGVRGKFGGKELDAESGLYYFDSRYYDPFLGRFTTSDDRLGAPPEWHDALNRYAFVLNNPVSNTDPTGHGFWEDFASGTASAAGHVASTATSVASAAKSFGNMVAGAFTSRVAQLAISFVVDAGLVAAGVVVLGTSPICGPAAVMLGNSLVGAGIGGFSYSIRAAVTGSAFSWKDWGIQVAIGAAAGLVMGAAVGLGSVGTAGIGAEVAGGAASGVTGQLLQNALVEHQALGTSLGAAALWGAGAALLAGTATALARRGLGRRAVVKSEEEEEIPGAEMYDVDPGPKFEVVHETVPRVTSRARALVPAPKLIFKGAAFYGKSRWYPDW